MKKYFTFISKLYLLTVLITTLNGCGFLKAYSRNYSLLDKPRFANVHEFNQKKLKNNTLKVVSYNIKKSAKVPKAITILKENNLASADIICLQEMDESGTILIAKTLEFNYVYYPSSIHDDKNFGNAILSKWPIVYDQKIILPHFNARMMQRIAVIAVLEVEGKKLMVVSAHFGVDLLPIQRGDQADQIIKVIPPHIEYVIVAGDFNALTRIHQYALLEPFREENFVIATKNVDWTYRHWYLLNKKSKLDYILSRDMQVLDSGKINDRSASDHVPIWADLKFSTSNK